MAVGRWVCCDRNEQSYDSEESETGSVSRIRFDWRFWSYWARKRPMVRVNKCTAKKKNNIPSFVFQPRSKKMAAPVSNNLIFIILLLFPRVIISSHKLRRVLVLSAVMPGSFNNFCPSNCRSSSISARNEASRKPDKYPKNIDIHYKKVQVRPALGRYRTIQPRSKRN